MNRYLIIQLLCLISFKANGQCTELNQAIIYIEHSLVSDLYYYSSWEPKEEDMDFIQSLKKEGVDVGHFLSKKEDIKKPLIWYMQEKLPYEQDGYADSEKLHKSKIKVVDKPHQKTTWDQANYLLFTSNIHENKLLIKVLDKRNIDLNPYGEKAEYQRLSKMNGGMVYLFQFNENRCIIGISKKYEFKE